MEGLSGSPNSNIYAIVVTFNGMKWIDRCIGSLLLSSTPLSIIVIDNASTDNTAGYIAEHFPSVQLISSQTNYGFAKANNIGIKIALENNAEYIFLLNQDAWIEKGTISELLSTAESDENIGIVSPIHMTGDGGALDWGFASYVPTDFVSDSFCMKIKRQYKADFINAAAWLLTRQCIEKVGGFDTNMFIHYGEDSNYCQRLKFHGFLLVVCTRSKIFHDRLDRKDNETEYRNRIFKQSDLNRRLEYGNILYDFDIDSFISQTKKSIIKSFFKLKLNQAKRLLHEKEFLIMVKFSRDRNKKGGLIWL